MNEWRIARIVLTLWFAVQVVYVSVPDYPWGADLYQAVTGVGNTPTEWLHEVAIIVLIYLGLLNLTFWWQSKTRPRTVYVIRRTEKV